jgi:tetratricopeptide (TPR) repeat protein
MHSFILNSYFQDRWKQYEYTQVMIDVADQHQDKWLIAFVLFAHSIAELLKDDYPEARRQAEIHLKLCEEIGDQVHATVSLLVIGHAALAQKDYEQAWGSYRRCLKLSRRIGFFYSLQTVTKYLGKTAISMGKLEEAEDYLLQCLEMTKEIGFVRDVINLYYEFARLAGARGYPERAVEILAFVIQHPASNQIRMMEGRIRDSAQELFDNLKGGLPEDKFQAAVEKGQGLELDQIYADLVN